MSRNDPRTHAAEPSPLFESLEPRAMLAGDYSIAWNGVFLNATTDQNGYIKVVPDPDAPEGTPVNSRDYGLYPPDVNVGDKLIPKNKRDTTKVRPILNISNIGDERIYGLVYFDYYLRPAAAVDNSQDIQLFNKVARGGLSVDSARTAAKFENQVDIKNLLFQVPYNVPSGSYVLVAIISRTYDTPDGRYKLNALPKADADANPANNTAISAPFNVSTPAPTWNLQAAIGTEAQGTNVPDSVAQGNVARGTVVVRVTNTGGSTAKVPAGANVTVSLYLRPSGAIDSSTDIAVGSLKNLSVSNLAIPTTATPARVAYVQFSTASVRSTLAAGTYTLIAVVDPLVPPAVGKPFSFSGSTGRLTELTETDNTASVGTFTVT